MKNYHSHTNLVSKMFIRKTLLKLFTNKCKYSSLHKTIQYEYNSFSKNQDTIWSFNNSKGQYVGSIRFVPKTGQIGYV